MTIWGHGFQTVGFEDLGEVIVQLVVEFVNNREKQLAWPVFCDACNEVVKHVSAGHGVARLRIVLNLTVNQAYFNQCLVWV